MTTKNKNKSSWVTDINKPEKIEIEPFSKNESVYNPDLIAFNGYLVMADRPTGGKKVNYALRIEEEINNNLANCQGSKNAVINALLKYAIADLKAKNKTLTSE